MKQWFEEEDFWVNYAPIMFDDARWAEAPDVAEYVKKIASEELKMVEKDTIVFKAKE